MFEKLVSRNTAYFLKCFEARNFTKAGRELRISQSALSVSIKALESELGAKLFVRVRGTSEISPTSEGIALYESLKAVRRTLGAANLSTSSQRASLKIACIQYFARKAVLPALRELDLLSRSKVFIVRSLKAIEAVKSKDVDLAFVIAKAPPIRDLRRCHEIKRERVGIVGAKPRFSHINKAKALDELREEPWIWGERVREDWPESLDDHRSGYYIEDHYSAQFLVLEGYGIAELQLDYFSKEELSRLAIASQIRSPFEGFKLYALARSNLDHTKEGMIASIIGKVTRAAKSQGN